MMPPLLRSRLFLGGCIVLAVALCYLPAMRAGFVWDDDLLVTENPLVQGADSLPYIWGTAASTDYTPLTISAFWLQWRLWGDNPAGYHLVNILLHAISALLLWRVLARLSIPGAWLGALLFAIHPVNVASVAWIAELKNALSLPFYLGAVACFLDFVETRKVPAYALALLAAVCAYLSKGSTVILPLVLLLCIGWKRRRVSRGDLLALLPFLALAAIAALVTIHFQGRIIDPGVVPTPMAARLARAGYAIWFYAWKDIWPLRLCPVYPKWPLPLSFLPIILAMSATILALQSAIRNPRSAIAFAWVYFVIALLPVLGFVDMSFLDQAYVADWWQQLALPGIVALVAAGIAVVWSRLPRAARPGLCALVAIMAISLGAQTWTEASGYESMETFCLRTLATNPDAWTAHNNLGNALASQGRLPEAMAEYQAALRLKPSNVSAHLNLGAVFARLHRLDDAVSQYHATLNLAPDNAKAWFNLGNALRAQRHDADAIDAFSHAIDYNARWVNPRYEMGTILLESGRAREAGRQAETIVKIEPDAISGHYLMARSAAAIGRFDVATPEAATALEIAHRGGQEKTIRQMQEALDACKAAKLPPVPEL